MLDPKLIRSRPDEIRQALSARGYKTSLVDEFLAEDETWRQLLARSEELKRERNTASQEIGRMKKEGIPSEAKQEEARGITEKIKALDAEVRTLEERLHGLVLFFPNPPHASVPPGRDASQNVVVRTWGEPHPCLSQPRPHWEIAEHLGLIDFARAAKLSGSMFSLYVGLGARLQRALIQFMLDLHVENHGYTEIYPPYLVKPEIMVGTGQLPKFQEEMYHVAPDQLYLIPTAEVPVTNLHRDEILSIQELPKYYASYTACFRREAGAAGSDTRGLQRLHQFDKVELVKIVPPETSYEEHEKLLADVEAVLRALDLHYRVILLCAGDLGFAAAKCYDVEAWCPAQKKWAEVSSCSNFEEFQARRANLRFRRGPQAKPEWVHTLNASGVALPRTVMAILENYQESECSVAIPPALQPYLGGLTHLELAQPAAKSG